MGLTPEEVKRVANLARLSLHEDEIETIATQLGKVVDLVTQLSVVNTEGVEPMVHAIEISNVLAEDAITPSLDRQEALRNAPASDDECFRVPPVLG